LSKEEASADNPNSVNASRRNLTARVCNIKKSNTKEQEKGKLTLDPKQEKHPLSSKVYELINKGYIHEKQPW